MHYLSEHNILIFLIQIFILLTTAKILGELCRTKGIPALVGEILTGVLLGPTILGRGFPVLYNIFFPQNLIQQNMLETVSWFGVLFLLLSTGFEINASTALRQKKIALNIGVIGVIVPIIIGIFAFWKLPVSLYGQNANHLTFTLFLAIAASITAIPVIAKVLHDLEITKSDLGLATISACTVNDIFGWMLFPLILGMAAQKTIDYNKIASVYFQSLLFGTLCLTVGSRFVGYVTVKLKKTFSPATATILSFISILAILCGAITQWIGIHAIFGFFLAGIMAGNTSEISERTRNIISQMVHAVFVPIFFATIGMKVDFLRNFNFLLAFLFFAVAVGGKFIGAWFGARMSKMSKPDALSIGIAFIPGGAMEIIIGMIALEMKLISGAVFSAIVFAGILSAVLAGPLLAWSISKRATIDMKKFLLKEAFVVDMKAVTPYEAIKELCAKAAQYNKKLDQKLITSAVTEREIIMSTAVEKGVAVPHSRLKGLERPIVVFGRSINGINWEAIDGIDSQFIFLILTPEEEQDVQVQILSAIAEVMTQDKISDQIRRAKDIDSIYKIITEALELS